MGPEGSAQTPVVVDGQIAGEPQVTPVPVAEAEGAAEPLPTGTPIQVAADGSPPAVKAEDRMSASGPPPLADPVAPVTPPPLAAGYPAFPGFALPPGYLPMPYPPGYYPAPYPFAPPAGAAQPQDWPTQQPFPPQPYPPQPYPPQSYPVQYPYPPQYLFMPPPHPPGFHAAPPPGFAPLALPQTPADRTIQAQNQRLMISGIIAAVLLIHLPWLLYLYGVHGCWGSFVEICGALGSAALEQDSTADTQMLFARVAFFMLRVQTVLSVDFAKFSEVLQLSTGLGSFVLTKIVAANGMVAHGNLRRFALAGTCAVAFVVLFWAELHLTGSQTYAVLGDETVLSYIDLELPPDFLVATEAKAGLMQYLQILRLADALIFGAALAMPRAIKGA